MEATRIAFIASSIIVAGCSGSSRLLEAIETAYMSDEFERAYILASEAIIASDAMSVRDIPAVYLHEAFACHALGLWEEGLRSIRQAHKLAGFDPPAGWWLIGSCAKREHHVNTVYIDLLVKNGLWVEAAELAHEIEDTNNAIRAIINGGNLVAASDLIAARREDLGLMGNAWEVVVTEHRSGAGAALSVAKKAASSPGVDVIERTLFQCIASEYEGTQSVDICSIVSGLGLGGGLAIGKGLTTLGYYRSAREVWACLFPHVPFGNPSLQTTVLVWSGFVSACIASDE